MYDKDDKRRLFWLMDEYLDGRITAPVFCDEFYIAYDLNIDQKKLSDLEKSMFSELSNIAGRFSEYEEDHKLDPMAFSTNSELREKVLITKLALSKV